MKTDDQTLIESLLILASDIQCEDGVAVACIVEGANRLRELKARIAKLEDALRTYSVLYLHDDGTIAREALKDDK
jgi:hypothetical protein